MEEQSFKILELVLQGIIIPIIAAAWFDLKKAIGINIKQDEQIKSLQREMDEVKKSQTEIRKAVFKIK